MNSSFLAEMTNVLISIMTIAEVSKTRLLWSAGNVANFCFSISFLFFVLFLFVVLLIKERHSNLKAENQSCNASRFHVFIHQSVIYVSTGPWKKGVYFVFLVISCIMTCVFPRPPHHLQLFFSYVNFFTSERELYSRKGTLLRPPHTFFCNDTRFRIGGNMTDGGLIWHVM